MATQGDGASARGPGSLVGRKIAGKYEVVARIGTGAMGTIYEANNTALGKRVAIKILHPHLASDESLVARFHREARAAARLDHPNCISIHDFGQTEDGILYIVMEYVEGEDLASVLRREGRIDPLRAVRIAIGVCAALDEAHAHSVIHRDLKPENIMLVRRRDGEESVKVLDFGIAKIQDASETFHTQAGIVCGTPEYMSPEQVQGLTLDARSDLYALGVVLYEMLVGQPPFQGEGPLKTVQKHLEESPRPPCVLRPDIPSALNELILELLSKERDGRPASALALKKRLEALEAELCGTSSTPLPESDAIEDRTQIYHPDMLVSLAPPQASSREDEDRTQVYDPRQVREALAQTAAAHDAGAAADASAFGGGSDDDEEDLSDRTVIVQDMDRRALELLAAQAASASTTQSPPSNSAPSTPAAERRPGAEPAAATASPARARAGAPADDLDDIEVARILRARRLKAIAAVIVFVAVAGGLLWLFGSQL